MEQKTYHMLRMAFTVIVAAACSVSVVRGNYVFPIIIGVTAAVALFSMKKRVTGVLADERDYQIAGNAARWSLNIYAVIAAISSMALMANRGNGSQYELVAQILAYSACALLIIQSLLFKFFMNKK